jgi:DNA invertase Pin-like site-specific DNA recombinase
MSFWCGGWIAWHGLKHLLTISEECRKLGVDLVSLRQNIDTTLPAGRLTFQILGAVAAFERELLRERVKEEWHRHGVQERELVGQPCGASDRKISSRYARSGQRGERPQISEGPWNHPVDDREARRCGGRLARPAILEQD